MAIESFSAPSSGYCEGSGHTFLMSDQAYGENQDCLVNIAINDFELRSHLKLDQLIALSHRSDKAVVSKEETH
jgi:hypothetical protein